MDLLAHGGAGEPPTKSEESGEVLANAVDRGLDRSTPLEAVLTTVRALEAAPVFNAGLGGAIQSDGVVRTDAGVMTEDGDCGAACSMPGVEHAISVARLVMDETPHVLLAGEGAIELAAAFDLETGASLRTEATESRYADADHPPADFHARLAWVNNQFGEGSESGSRSDRPAGDDPLGTVGAVAGDAGSMAAATSTGGRWFALAGRVGDVPQVGGGFYAGSAGAVSATGHGEAIATFGLARRIEGRLADGEHPEVATSSAIDAFEKETGATAGAIAVDRSGALGYAHNAAAMPLDRGHSEG